MLVQSTRHEAAPVPDPSSVAASINALLATARRALDTADRVARLASANCGTTADLILSRYGWPALDQARIALEEAVGIAAEVLDEAAAAADQS